MASVFVESESRDGSAASRPHFWGIANEMAKDYPVGVGPECYREYYNSYDDSNGLYGLNRVVHSTHFQILAENGYIGILIWITLIIISYLRLFKLRRIAINDKGKLESPHFYRQACEALLCSQTVFILGGSFYSFVYADHIWVIFGLVMIITKLMQKEMADNKVMLKTNS
jgi:O-antigen ligase